MLTTSFPGTLDSLSAIRAFVAEAASQAGLGAHAIYRLRLAVDEVATNIVIHGYASARRTGTLELSARLTQGSLAIEIQDTGAPYEPTALQLPTPQELARPLEERRVGGLGLFIVMQSVDDFHHERLGTKNRTTLVIHLAQGASQRR